MKILALEFSSHLRSVAVAEATGGVVKTLGAVTEHDEKPRGPLALVEQALVAAGVSREQIESIAVGLGPGSYTGIRMAIAVAQGWELARGVRVLGVSSADCLAEKARQEQIAGPLHIAIDAQRNEFYLATYDLGQAGFAETAKLRLATREEVNACERTGGMVIGPEVTRWFQAGRIVVPDAATLAALAAQRSHFVPADQLAPIYLREASFVKAPPPRVLPA
ncbi:MAG: tRNA (adenosine(37)-N6)-threonylcarbamoyltransferase complex dimerization subunit type 1 TsaB [Verrucomicrobiota bacterium]